MKAGSFSRRNVLALAGAALLPAVAGAQTSFPTKAVRIVVPFGPGSGADTFARFVAEPAARLLGQPVIVENKAGADGIIGTLDVRRSAPDGYNVLMGSNSTLIYNPVARADLQYKLEDFRPIYGIARGPALLVVPANSPFRSMADLVSEAKKKTKLAIATYSPAQQMAAAWLGTMLGIEFTYVPYKGAAPMMSDLIGAQVPMGIADASALSEHVRAGKMRALGIAGPDRLNSLPGVPTMSEVGFPELIHYSWTAMVVPAATPDAAVKPLENMFAEIVASPEYAALAERTGVVAMRLSAQQLTEMFNSETVRYRRLIKIAGLEPPK